MKLKTAGGKQANKIKAPRSNPCKGMSHRVKNTAAILMIRISTPDRIPTKASATWLLASLAPSDINIIGTNILPIMVQEV